MTEKQIINDLDHFVICKYLKENNVEELKKLQKIYYERGFEEGYLISDLAEYNKDKKPIEFPFIK